MSVPNTTLPNDASNEFVLNDLIGDLGTLCQERGACSLSFVTPGVESDNDEQHKELLEPCQRLALEYAPKSGSTYFLDKAMDLDEFVPDASERRSNVIRDPCGVEDFYGRSCGLKSTHLNGLCGRITSYDLSRRRFGLHTFTGRAMLLKPENIHEYVGDV